MKTKSRFTCSIFKVLWAWLIGGIFVVSNISAATFTLAPATVSNTYSGTISLQIGGLTNGESVVVQKFLDLNTNGTIDAGDYLVQQFTLTDGTNSVIGGVTNFNVPGDLNATGGAITATLNFQAGDFVQNLIGNFLYKVSSPVGNFTPITNLFAVTNFPYAQKITGSVVNSGTNVPNAVVVLFPPPRNGNHGPGTPVAGAVANNAGVYTIQVPSGSYVPLAFRSNFVANFSTSPQLSLSASQTITTNLILTNATASITGKYVDANNSSLGLPGIFAPFTANPGLIAVCFTDTNGNFIARVTAGEWGFGSDSSGLSIHGYVGSENGTNANAGTTGIVLGFPKATALFYGRVTDISGNPLVKIDLEAYDNNGLYDLDAFTDTNGNYCAAVVGGLGNNDLWWLQAATDDNPTNYIFSQPSFDQNNGLNLPGGQTSHQNFTALPVTGHIAGNVQYQGANVSGVAVSAYATISGVDYFANVDTDDNGNYSLNVANGSWSVDVACQGGDDSLDGMFGNGNYQCPDNQGITINNNNGTANFTIQPCGGVQIITTSPLTAGQVGAFYSAQFAAESCNNNFSWSANDPADLPSGLTFSGGVLNGTPTAGGTYNFSIHVQDGSGNATNKSFSISITGGSPLQANAPSVLAATNGIFFSQMMFASGGVPPYRWSIPNYSADPPANLTLTTNGVLSGTPSVTVGAYAFDVEVTDSAANTAYETLTVNVVNPPAPPLFITNSTLPGSTIGAAYNAQLGATGGQPPYNWSLAVGSAQLSTVGLSLNASGLISGTPTTNKVFTFKVQVTDNLAAVTNKVLSITINPPPSLGTTAKISDTQFQFSLNGYSNQNYTLQVSTNLSSTNWASLFVTNSSTNGSFLITDPSATNQQRFYRVLIGP